MSLFPLIARDLKRKRASDRSAGAGNPAKDKPSAKKTAAAVTVEQMAPLTLLRFRNLWRVYCDEWPSIQDYSTQTIINQINHRIFLENDVGIYIRELMSFTEISTVKFTHKSLLRDIIKLKVARNRASKALVKKGKIVASDMALQDFDNLPIVLQLYESKMSSKDDSACVLNFPLKKIICDTTYRRKNIDYKMLLRRINCVQTLLLLYVLEIRKNFQNEIIFIDYSVYDSFLFQARSIPNIVLHQQYNCFLRSKNV